LQVSGPEWDEANLYRHLIRVRRSTIRMDADELTYPVHIMLRYELEKRSSRARCPWRIYPRRGTRIWNSA